MPSPQTLFDFQTPDAAENWRTINDTVMGGVSTSEFVATDEGAVFQGTVSLDRGGGFASVRAPEDRYDLSGTGGLRLVVRGDEKRYKLTLYTRSGGRISYRVPFDAPRTWHTVALSFDALTPFRRGRRVPDAPPFDPSDVRALGVLIGDKQAGPFRLYIRSIVAAANLES
jgi:monofunctional biosynthetic peptidoglycan transglycosylase